MCKPLGDTETSWLRVTALEFDKSSHASGRVKPV